MQEIIKISRIMFSEKKGIFLSILFGYITAMTTTLLFAVNGIMLSLAAVKVPIYLLISMVAIIKIGSLIRASGRYFERIYSHDATFSMLNLIRLRFYEKLSEFFLTTTQQFHKGDLLVRMVGDIEQLQNLFLQSTQSKQFLFTQFITGCRLSIKNCLIYQIMQSALLQKRF